MRLLFLSVFLVCGCASQRPANDFVTEIETLQTNLRSPPFGDYARAKAYLATASGQTEAKSSIASGAFPLFLQFCANGCDIPGLAVERQNQILAERIKVMRIPGVSEFPTKEAIPYMEASHKFASSFNIEMDSHMNKPKSK